MLMIIIAVQKTVYSCEFFFKMPVEFEKTLEKVDGNTKHIIDALFGMPKFIADITAPIVDTVAAADPSVTVDPMIALVEVHILVFIHLHC